MKFEILKNGSVLETRELGEGSYKIGRAADCEIMLKSLQVSKHHALLVIKGDKAAIVDTGSSNGVFVNGILIRKQRIGLGDTVEIVDHQIRIAKEKAKVNARTAGAVAGNAAMKVDLESNPEETPAGMTPQERLLYLMDQRVLLPFYSLMRSFDWRLILSTILLGTLLLSVLLSVIPIVRWGKEITTKESLERAHTVVTQVVRENYRILSKTSDKTRLTVDAAEKADGFLKVFIIDTQTKNILAPAQYFNKSINDDRTGTTDVYALLAVNRVLEGKEEHVSLDRGDGIYVVAQKIPYVGGLDTTNPDDVNPPSPSAIVLAYFQIPTSISSTFEPLSEACLFSVVLSLLAYFLIFKMFSHPIIALHEQLDAALKGEEIDIHCDAKMPELETLATVINFSVTRLKQAGGATASLGGSNAEEEEKAFIQSVQEFDVGTSDALLLLDKDKRVKFVGRALEELLGMRNQYAQGQNVSDACRDQSFAGTVIDLSERVVQSLGESQFANLEVNGISRNVSAVAHRDGTGEIKFVLVTVKLNG